MPSCFDTAWYMNRASRCSASRCSASRCSASRCRASRCSASRCIASRCSAFPGGIPKLKMLLIKVGKPMSNNF